jgi:lauroyl/myristoyl acyltransferase
VVPADFAVLLGLPLLGVLSWCVPERYWRPAADLARSLVPGRSEDRPLAAKIARALAGQPCAIDPFQICEAFRAHAIVLQCQILRFHRPNSWRPPIDLVGREHIDAALAEGRGAVLWVNHFASSGIVTKMGLHRAGYPVVHLSNVTHGYSESRFGMRFLNPIRISVENHHLVERVTFSYDAPTAAVRRLQRCLKENRVVTVTAREKSARPAVVPFLSAQAAFATGAPDLAYVSKAPLLPVSTVRREDGTFVVTVEPPLSMDREVPRSEATGKAASEFARRLEPYVLQYPAQWLGWKHLPEP